MGYRLVDIISLPSRYPRFLRRIEGYPLGGSWDGYTWPSMHSDIHLKHAQTWHPVSAARYDESTGLPSCRIFFHRLNTLQYRTCWLYRFAFLNRAWCLWMARVVERQAYMHLLLRVSCEYHVYGDWNKVPKTSYTAFQLWPSYKSAWYHSMQVAVPLQCFYATLKCCKMKLAYPFIPT